MVGNQFTFFFFFVNFVLSFLEGPATYLLPSSISEASITDLLRQTCNQGCPSFRTRLSQHQQNLEFVGQLFQSLKTSSARVCGHFQLLHCGLCNIRATDQTFYQTSGQRRKSLDPRTSERFVAAITIIPSYPQTIPFQLRAGSRVCSRSSFPPPRPTPRWRPAASISSIKKIMAGAALASSKREQARLA